MPTRGPITGGRCPGAGSARAARMDTRATLEGMMNTQRNRGHVSKRLGLSVWNSETTRLGNQRLLERLEAENTQLRRNVVDLMLHIQALRDGARCCRDLAGFR